MVFEAGKRYYSEDGQEWEVMEISFCNGIMRGATMLCRGPGSFKRYKGTIQDNIHTAAVETDSGTVIIHDGHRKNRYRRLRRPKE